MSRKRPSLADSLRASLSFGAHVDTAEKIASATTPETELEPDKEPAPAEAPKVTTLAVVRPSDIPPSAVGPSDSKPSDSQLPDYQTVKQSAVERSDIARVDKQMSNGPISHQHHDVVSMSYNQAAVFEFLIYGTGKTNMRTIYSATGVTIPSVRDAISRLVRRGFMGDPVPVRTATWQGFSYVLNQPAVDYFLSIGGLEKSNLFHRSPNKTTNVRRSDIGLSDGQRSHGPRVHSSSSLEEKLTTTGYHTVAPSTIRGSDITLPAIERSDMFSSGVAISDGGMSDGPIRHISTQGFILVGAVGEYWLEEGLVEGQAQKWCAQFEVDPTQMKQQLEWARYDLELNNRQAEVKKDKVSWFFGHLRKTGGSFPRPTNYRSPAEMRAEAMELEIARQKDAQERIIQAQLELEFQNILADPEGGEYLALIAEVNEYARSMGGTALENVLRDKFMEFKTS